jgi:hypothetical protein
MAEHDQESKISDETAYTLRDGEWRVGLWKAEYGILDSLDLSTYIWPWFLGLAHLHAKWEFWSNESWSFALRAGFFFVDLTRFEALREQTSDAHLFVAPFEGLLSYRFDDDWSLGGGLVFTKVAVRGSFDAEEFHGTAAVTNLQLHSTLEWRLSKVTALLLHLRWLAYQTVSSSTRAVWRPDDATTVELIGRIESDGLDVQNAWSTLLAVHFSWEVFNLRLGVGYGNYSIPGLNFVIPTKTPIPEIDLYWRW